MNSILSKLGLKHNEGYEQYIAIEKQFMCSKQEFALNPKISFVMATYNSSPQLLEECIQSVINQTYSNWELCIADDCSTNDGSTRAILEKYVSLDSRIKCIFREENGHICRATNTALSTATGEYIVLIDHDDVVSPYALSEFVAIVNTHPNVKLIYSDEDKITQDGKRFEPYFKPDFGPETFHSIIFIKHLTMYRRDILEQVGGFDPDYVGAQDYEITLRYINAINYNEIYHVPKILYHWRTSEQSIATNPKNKVYAFENAVKALTKSVDTKGLPYTLDETEFYGARFSVNYKPVNNPRVSIITCLRDHVDLLQNLIISLQRMTTYPNYEIIIVNNQSVEDRTYAYFDSLCNLDNVTIIDVDDEFNFSYINNVGAKQATGDYLLFVNNDIEITTSDWIERMVGYAQQEHIGAVGARLLYPNRTLQHSGVVIGFGEEGTAGHIFAGADYYTPGYFESLQIPYNYSAVTAACLMVAKDKFNEVNGFDEALKVAYNDVDLCLKLRSNGYFNISLPKVELIHYESISRGHDVTPKKAKRLEMEKEYFVKRWKKVIQNDPFYNINFSLDQHGTYQLDWRRVLEYYKEHNYEV